MVTAAPLTISACLRLPARVPDANFLIPPDQR
jgi:hypothetical protein